MIDITELQGTLQKIVTTRNRLGFAFYVNKQPEVKEMHEKLSLLLSKEGTTDSLEQLITFYNENETKINKM